jgi:glycosyltransferase involved in cell wall biosynthesis
VRAPLGVDLRLFKAAEPFADGPRLVHVGALTPVKDQATLLHAFAELHRRVPEVRLDIAGRGPLRDGLQRLAVQLGVADDVVFRGEVAHDALPEVYAVASAFVLSSRHEAQGMVALEAAACCRPVVGTRVGVLPELEPAAGAIASVGDAVGLADRLSSVLEDRRARGSAARELVEREFSLDGCAERFRGIYRQLLSG